MLTCDSVKAAILEILHDSEPLTETEVWRALCSEMNPNISLRDSSHALGLLLKEKRVIEEIERNPLGAHTGMPSLYWRA
jgi:hypothetical protein